MDSFLDMFSKTTSFLQSATKSVVDVAQGVANAKFQWQSQDLDVKLKNAQINSANNQLKLQTSLQDTQLQIAKINAQNQLAMAQAGIFGIGSFNADNINQALANVSTTLRGGQASGGSSIMLWLTVAGVAFAAMQYFKSK